MTQPKTSWCYFNRADVELLREFLSFAVDKKLSLWEVGFLSTIEQVCDRPVVGLSERQCQTLVSLASRLGFPRWVWLCRL
jgi:hypothetical protein